jgi:hypothetical protein
MRWKLACIGGILVGFIFSMHLDAFAAGYSIKATSQTPRLEKRKSIIDSILISYNPIFSYKTLFVLIDEKLREPRGKIYGQNITLSAHIWKDGEFVKLFVHELAHYVDIYFLLPTRTSQDLSNSFYDISWEKPLVKKSWEWVRSFVSGYAATNQYEDFAESFIFYVFHNEDFADVHSEMSQYEKNIFSSPRISSKMGSLSGQITHSPRSHNMSLIVRRFLFYCKNICIL